MSAPAPPAPRRSARWRARSRRAPTDRSGASPARAARRQLERLARERHRRRNRARRARGPALGRLIGRSSSGTRGAPATTRSPAQPPCLGRTTRRGAWRRGGKSAPSRGAPQLDRCRGKEPTAGLRAARAMRRGESRATASRTYVGSAPRLSAGTRANPGGSKRPRPRTRGSPRDADQTSGAA